VPSFSTTSIWLRLHRPCSFRDSPFSMFGPRSVLWDMNRLTNIPLPWPLSKRHCSPHVQASAFSSLAMKLKSSMEQMGHSPLWQGLGSPTPSKMLTPAAEERRHDQHLGGIILFGKQCQQLLHLGRQQQETCLGTCKA
jgi:hypothetical protein